MSSTLTVQWPQLENATREFRDALARRHREKVRSAKLRARCALDQWEPEPLGLTNLETGEAIDDMPEPLVLADGRVPLTSIEVEPHPFLPSYRRVKTESTFASRTAWVRSEIVIARSMARWHEGRDNGQKYRFKNLSQCGSRVMIAHCTVCKGDRKPVEEGCGIARLCERCSLRKAKKRRARFGRARQRVSTHLARLGCLRSRRVGGKRIGPRWSDKMLTLTIPHALRCNVDPEKNGAPTPMFALAEKLWGRSPEQIDTAMMRVLALRAAWPIFVRKLRAHWKQAEKAAHKAKLPGVMVPWKDGEHAPPPFHRAFEWTPGKDGLGHPHFHVWILCPFLSVDMVAAIWTEAIREAGLPCERAIVSLQRFRDFDRNAVGELIKAGDRQALEWSRLYKHGMRGAPANAFEYADGWTISEALRDASAEVVASLYCALEGMRLTQAAAGFFTEDEPAACTCGAQGCWHIVFEPAPPPELVVVTPASERGPPK